LNGVPAYAGLAAVDIFIGATELKEDDPLNKVYPGEFLYGGGHVIHDLLEGKSVYLEAHSYGTDCYPRTHLEKRITLSEMPYARLINPRNGYQNYNVAVNLTNKTVYTYMGMLRPRMGNANYCTAGQLSPLLNDPYYKVIGMGTRIFLGGGVGYVIAPGTQHNPDVPRTDKGVPTRAAGTLMLTGDLKCMSPRWIVGVSILGYGCSLAVGLGVPIPILNEEIAAYTGVSDEDIVAQVVDYGDEYPSGNPRCLTEVSYAQLKSGTIVVEGKEVPTAPLSSYVRAKEIALILKEWIEAGKFMLSSPFEPLPGPSDMGS